MAEKEGEESKQEDAHWLLPWLWLSGLTLGVAWLAFHVLVEPFLPINGSAMNAVVVSVVIATAPVLWVFLMSQQPLLVKTDVLFVLGNALLFGMFVAEGQYVNVLWPLGGLLHSGSRLLVYVVGLYQKT
jgi:hypothetical protein